MPLPQKNTKYPVTAPAHIETHERESALRSALYAHERHLADLHAEFHSRELKLRDEYLAVVAAITNSQEDGE